MLALRASLVAIAFTLAACQPPEDVALQETGPQNYNAWYTGLVADVPFDYPLVNKAYIDPRFHRQRVDYTGGEAAGTIVVDIDNRFLYLVEEGGKAMRYGIGVGRNGFAWRGDARIARKGVWPNWSPTDNMRRIIPDLPAFMEGGLDNPLGARALYLYQGDRDTLFRIHGTNEPWSIGEQVSSGCVRLLNEDIVDLYNRVSVGARVTVRRGGVRA
ncbi:MAG: L,D-transpeptidase [Salinarimonadaceae bacterium]|nr:MAG: L,D-transpeptidase [Salinarimonadaceae bacterium]